uniref:C2H2-type domain-containing protein n=1 Tax=Timema tahoe TaxID=61484 RepID=A0A7R9NWZ5_9NEOP|nr:unnamed protein product [Timema tahoe]
MAKTNLASDVAAVAHGEKLSCLWEWNEPTHTIHYLPSQGNDVEYAWNYLNLEKCVISKGDKDFNEPHNEVLKKRFVSMNVHFQKIIQNVIRIELDSYLFIQDREYTRLVHVIRTWDVWDVIFKDKKNRHRQFHYGQRKYKCDVYGAVLKGKGNFNRHLLIHSGQEKYTCDVCYNVIKGKENFNRHLLIHSGQEKYKCDVWDKELVRGSFKRNLLFDSEIRPFKCDVYDKVDSLELTATELLSIDLLTLGSAESLARGRGQSFPTRRSFRWDIGFGGGVGTVVPEVRF